MRYLVSLIAFAVLMNAQPRRIVSTAPSFTETVFAIGAGNRVVGVSQHCHFPLEVDRLPRIGTYIKPNIEAIVRLKPDLVLATLDGNSKDQVNHLKELGVPDRKSVV